MLARDCIFLEVSNFANAVGNIREFLDLARKAIQRVELKLLLVTGGPHTEGKLTAPTAHHLAYQYAEMLWSHKEIDFLRGHMIYISPPNVRIDRQRVKALVEIEYAKAIAAYCEQAPSPLPDTDPVYLL